MSQFTAAIRGVSPLCLRVCESEVRSDNNIVQVDRLTNQQTVNKSCLRWLVPGVDSIFTAATRGMTSGYLSTMCLSNANNEVLILFHRLTGLLDVFVFARGTLTNKVPKSPYHPQLLVSEMDSNLPTPPTNAPKYIREGLPKQSSETLREIARYAQQLADSKEQAIEAELEEESIEQDSTPEEWDENEWDTVISEVDSPQRACLTTKTIDGRDYFYFQWREGSKIKSKYVAPVSPVDSQ